ncbi:hypothetical protein DENSPDRAFT_886366 [Dentipellis sp. KUC8613]|nr:hypothetical protein DENSPDRAFT_886366 [Dentipellis sp. KUC8613]
MLARSRHISRSRVADSRPHAHDTHFRISTALSCAFAALTRPRRSRMLQRRTSTAVPRPHVAVSLPRVAVLFRRPLLRLRRPRTPPLASLSPRCSSITVPRPHTAISHPRAAVLRRDSRLHTHPARLRVASHALVPCRTPSYRAARLAAPRGATLMHFCTSARPLAPCGAVFCLRRRFAHPLPSHAAAALAQLPGTPPQQHHAPAWLHCRPARLPRSLSRPYPPSLGRRATRRALAPPPLTLGRPQAAFATTSRAFATTSHAFAMMPRAVAPSQPPSPPLFAHDDALRPRAAALTPPSRRRQPRSHGRTSPLAAVVRLWDDAPPCALAPAPRNVTPPLAAAVRVHDDTLRRRAASPAPLSRRRHAPSCRRTPSLAAVVRLCDDASRPRAAALAPPPSTLGHRHAPVVTRRCVGPQPSGRPSCLSNGGGGALYALSYLSAALSRPGNRSSRGRCAIRALATAHDVRFTPVRRYSTPVRHRLAPPRPRCPLPHLPRPLLRRNGARRAFHARTTPFSARAPPAQDGSRRLALALAAPYASSPPRTPPAPSLARPLHRRLALPALATGVGRAPHAISLPHAPSCRAAHPRPAMHALSQRRTTRAPRPVNALTRGPSCAPPHHLHHLHHRLCVPPTPRLPRLPSAPRTSSSAPTDAVWRPTDAPRIPPIAVSHSSAPFCGP